MIKLSDLYRKPVRDTDGKGLGVVHDVSIKDGEVVALHFGAGNFFERFTGKSHGGRASWDAVRSVTAKAIVIDARA